MICSVFFTTFTAFFYPQNPWLFCSKPCPSSPARKYARAPLPSLRCWEVFGRIPIITTLPIPISVGLHSKCWEQTCACWSCWRCIRKRFGSVYRVCLGNLGSAAQSLMEDVPGLPWGCRAGRSKDAPQGRCSQTPHPSTRWQETREITSSPLPLPISASFLSFFVVGGKHKFIY